ncbi:MAG: hypothetical protein IPJ46_10580 [Anaerolineales bacterium]|nr:hypothetical protein [Anaerolineales bacterium]
MKFIIVVYWFHVMYRITGGKFGGEMANLKKVLILTTKGRKSVEILSAPLDILNAMADISSSPRIAETTRSSWYHATSRAIQVMTIQVKDKR